MELNEFLEKFLPDYNKRFEKAKSEAPSYWVKDDIELWAWYDIFPEALQNFTDKICEKQREYCSGACPMEMDESDWEYVLNAKQPKLEDL